MQVSRGLLHNGADPQASPNPGSDIKINKLRISFFHINFPNYFHDNIEI